MALFNFGSINIDNVFELDRMPQIGETLSAKNFSRGLGGKGANQSVAIAKSGNQIHHIGTIAQDGIWMAEELKSLGVDVALVETLENGSSGQAIIYVDASGENSIVLHAGANHEASITQIEKSLKNAGAGDWLILQNETNLVVEAARIARSQGMKIAYSAAPFEAKSVESMLEYVDLIAVNEIEMQQLQEELPQAQNRLVQLDLLVTKGSRGASFINGSNGGEKIDVSSFNVEVVDTTGAGDTFFGYFISALHDGKEPNRAFELASAAAAIQVTKLGASTAIPQVSEVLEFLNQAK